MKKHFFFLLFAIVASALNLSADDICDRDYWFNGNNDGGIEWSALGNGCYVVGEATAIQADVEYYVSTADAQLALMGAGINEATKQPRAGLYEKYIALEANKPFEIVYVNNYVVTHYGAQLVKGDPYDVANGITIQVYKGELVENKTMSVPTSGFYHIALDLNVANDLPAKSIIVSPVEWQFSNGNDVMTASAFNKKEMSWTLTGKEILRHGKYKYRWGNGWKIKVTPAAEVNIATNLGAGMKSGGYDIDIARGKYDITLTWKLAGGAIEKGFTENVNKVADIAAANYSNSEIVLVGDGVEGTQTGAQHDYQNANGGWAWGNIISLGKPQKNGYVYTWQKDVVLVVGRGFKVRSNKTTDSPYVEFGKDGGSDDVTVDNSGTYTVKVVINADTEEKSITCTPKNVVIADYTNSEICVVGVAVDSNTPDPVWSWGNIASLGKPQKNGYVYTWTGQVTLKAGACKIRSIHGTADDPYVEMGKDGGSDYISITAAEAGVYTFTVVIDAQTGTKSVNYYKNRANIKSASLFYNISLIKKKAGTVTILQDMSDDEVQVIATPTRCFCFVQWADGNKDNPRTIKLTQDITIEAIFDYLAADKCGKDSALTWTLDTASMALTVTGTGALSANYTYGAFIGSVTIGNEVTIIGQSAFSRFPCLTDVIIGSSVKVIEQDAFYGCTSLQTITCYSMRPPTVNNNAFYGMDYSTIIYVPADYLNNYQMHDFWGMFDVRPLGAATTETTNEVKVKPSGNSADMSWPTVTGAATYELVIKDKSGNVICTLVFNSAGQLTSIAFAAPARDRAPVETLAAGFSFTVTGLSAGTWYAYTLTSKDGSGNVLDTKTGAFTTDGLTAIDEVNSAFGTSSAPASKLLRSGQVLIQRAGKTYTLQGQEVR